ncbi:uncharacterized protein CDAR_71961 [Caerostris darwini]|uniref:Uncharacterized protein n=1 Tax=Caerostris darwini TaxID=1538125 RepID=A0AAV4W7L3_9ARAC|nr:uncharacterized protein CDAR_71961 [Caerostris darwini]
MTEKIEFKIISNCGELNSTQGDLNLIKLDFSCISNTEYELISSFLGSSRLIYGKFTLNRALVSCGTNDDDQESNPVKISIWKTVYLPFPINDASISNNCLWILGKDFYVDINSQLKSILQVKTSYVKIDDNFMDIDSSNEFNFKEFEANVKITSFKNHKPQNEKFYLECSLFQGSIVVCTKDILSMKWQLDLIIPSYSVHSTSEHSKLVPLISFPVFYSDSFSSEDSFREDWKTSSFKPVSTFIQNNQSSDQGHDELQKNIIFHLLGLFPPSLSNCICFIGHPEGKLLFCLCSLVPSEQNILFNTELEVLYDFKQAIVGIHLLTEMNGVAGNGLLIIGAIGKIAYVTKDKVYSNSAHVKVKNKSFHIATLFLPSSVQEHIVFRNCILHISDKNELWVSEISKKGSCDPHEDLKIFRNTIAFLNILKIVLLNELLGLFLFVTKYGNLYLTEYTEKESEPSPSLSLPSLMNEIMYQSAVLRKLSSTSKKQQQFFAAVSKFASLKFNVNEKFKITCSITEVNVPPKKYVIDICIKSTENLDSEFWFVTASLYNYYQKDSIVISKTLLFESNQTITIEIQEFLLSSQHCSQFPVFLEIGLLLTLPESFISEECFKLIAKMLPLYMKIETLILNELYLLKSKSQQLINKSQYDQQTDKNILTNICTRNLKTPVAYALNINRKIFTNYPQDFTFCFLPKKVKEEKSEKDFPAELFFIDEVFQTLKIRSNLFSTCEFNSLICKNQDVSFHSSDGTYVTIRTKSFFLLAGLRMAIMELFLNIQNKSKDCGSKYVSISAIVNKECEKLSKDLSSMYGKDVEVEDFFEALLFAYCQLRKISKMLPFC